MKKLILGLSLVSLLLVGCGQTGNLFLPDGKKMTDAKQIDQASKPSLGPQ